MKMDGGSWSRSGLDLHWLRLLGCSRAAFARAAGVLALVCLAVLGTAGCTRRIGDSCKTNVECSPLGDRFCDLASPDGYCTVEGCDNTTCPDSAVCVRFFSLKIGDGLSCDSRLSARAAADCAPGTPGCCVAGTPGCCRIGEQCLCDQPDCGKNGYCASESTERRWCMHGCSSDGDCRNGFQCLPTGSNGTLGITVRNDDGTIDLPTYSYCAPPL